MAERIILGVDPGLASTGIGVVALGADGTMRAVAWRQATTSPRTALPDRLATIHDLVASAVKEHRPEIFAIEDIFFARNVKSAVLLAYGRSAALLAARAAGASIVEYAPREVKLAVTGRGNATKEQVKKLTALVLGMAQAPASDHESDALAVALCAALRASRGVALRAPKVSRRMAEPPPPDVEDPRKALLALRRTTRRRRR